MATSAPPVDSPQLRAIRLWCRRRADVKMGRCRDIQPYRWRGMPHQEIRYQLGLTVDEYRRARRWLDEAAEQCANSSDHLGFEETLRRIADRHVENVFRYGLLRAEGLTFEQIREHLKLTEREVEIISEWWRDALAAVSERRMAERE